MDRLTRFRKVIALLAVLTGMAYLTVRATHMHGSVAWLAWPLLAVEAWGFAHFALSVTNFGRVARRRSVSTQPATATT